MTTLSNFNEAATDLSAPVDVLAIMDRAADSADYAPATDEMVHAIDAVAELIEAGNRVTDAFRVLGVATPRTRSADNARYECEEAMLALDAALARCNGGAP